MWYSHTESIQGAKTNMNQDYLAVNQRDNTLLAVLCDGMGGEKSGEVASRLCVKSIADSYLEEYNPEYTADWLIAVVKEANRFVYDYSIIHTKCTGMGTTLVSILIRDKKFFVANIGDSRFYSYNKKEFKQLTEDDSIVWKLHKQGRLRKDEIVKHPSGHVITKSIAMERDVDPVVHEFKLGKENLFLLCSDGLTDYLTDQQIQEKLDQGETLSAKSSKLLEAALNEGSKDDISIILLSDYIK